MSTRVAAVLAIAAAAGCVDDTLDPVVIDVSSNCVAVDVSVALDQLETASPLRRVIEAMADTPGGARAWLLVELATGSGTRLALQHVDETGTVDAEVIVDVPPALADTISLVHGARDGELWVMERGTAHLQIAHLDAAVEPPLVSLSFQLGWFPTYDRCDEDEDGVLESCDTSDWPRELVIVDGRAYVLSIPPRAVDLTTAVLYGELSSDGQTLGSVRADEFTVSCDETQLVDLVDLAACQAGLAEKSWAALDVLGMQTGASGSSAWILLRREEIVAQPEGDIPVGQDIALLELRHDANQVAVVSAPSCFGHLTSDNCDPAVATVPIMGPPSGLATDRTSRFALHATDGLGSQLWEIGIDRTELVTPLELADDMTLLQLDRDIALGRIADGVWEITKVFPDAPERSEVTTWGKSVVAVAPAGPGSFLVREDAGARLVNVTCRE